jgi:hypothetical protein
MTMLMSLREPPSFFTSPLEGEVDHQRKRVGDREGGKPYAFDQANTPLPNPPPHSSPDGERPLAYGGMERTEFASPR